MPFDDIYEGDPLDALLQAIEEKDKDKFQSMDDLLRAIEEPKAPISPEVPPYEQAKTFITETVPTNITKLSSAAVESLRRFNNLATGVLPPTPQPEDMAVSFARLLPGQENFSDWNELSPGKKTLVMGQVASIIPLAIAGIQAGMGIPEAIKEAIRTHRIKTGKFYVPPTRAEALKAAGKKVEITKGFTIEGKPETKARLVTKMELRPTTGVPSPQKIYDEFTRSIPRITRQLTPTHKVVKTGSFKALLQDYIYRTLNAQTPSRVLDQACQDAASRLVERTLRGVSPEISLDFAKSLYDKSSMLDKLLPVAVQQLKAYGHISPTLFGEKAVSPEEEIVDREMMRPLTKTPEEYAVPEVAPKAEPTPTWVKKQIYNPKTNEWISPEDFGYTSHASLLKHKARQLDDYVHVTETNFGYKFVKDPDGILQVLGKINEAEKFDDYGKTADFLINRGVRSNTPLSIIEYPEIRTLADMSSKVAPILEEAALRAEEEVRPGGIESIGLSVKEIEKGNFPTFDAPDIADQMRYGPTEKSFLLQAKEGLTKVKDALGDAFYRNYALRFKLKKPDVDMMFRNFFSTTELREKDAKEWVKHTFGTIDAKDAIALALHQEWPEKYPIPDRLKDVANKQTAVYEFWDKTLQSYGIYKEAYPQSMIHRSLKQIEKLKEEITYLKRPSAIKRRRAKIEQLEELVGILKGVRYLPHRYVGRIENMIIEESADKDVTRLIPRRYSNVLRATFKEIKGRKIPTLEEAAKLGFVPQLDARYIMADYLLYVQREIAKVDLARKLINDTDLILSEDVAPDDWQKVAMGAFKGYKVHPALVDAIDEVAGIRRKEWQPLVWYAKVAKTTKLLKFFLPQIMVINNLWQGYWVGGVRAAIDPTVWGWSIKQMAGNTPLYKRFIELDLFPTPPDVRPSRKTQDEMVMMWVRHMDKNYPKVARAIERATNGEWNFKGKNPIEALGGALKGFYAMIWNTTWGIDRIQRMNSTKRLMDKGMSMEEAVERARFFHVDYADLPGEARRKLNLIFLTPTYRTGMLKVYGAIMRDPVKYKGPLARWLAAWFGVALGATVTHHTVKEYYRITKAMGEGEEQVYTVPSGMAELQKYIGRGPYASWKIYSAVPPYVIHAIFISNRDWKGDQIYYPAESATEQACDIADFILRSVFPPLEMLGMMRDENVSLKNKLLRFLAISGYPRQVSEFWKPYQLQELERQARQLLRDKYPEGAPKEVMDALIERMQGRATAITEEKPGLLDIGAHMQRGLMWGLEHILK